MKEKVRKNKSWRSRAALFVLAFALLFLTDYFASVSLAVSAGRVTAKGANIRKEASTTSTALGGLVENDKVEILGQTVGADGKVWYQIYCNGTNTGFIRSDLVEITDGSTPPTIDGGAATVTPAPAASPETPAANVTAEQVVPVGGKVSGSNAVRVRTSPTTANNNNILTSVSNGSEVTVVARATGEDNMLWYQIKFVADGKELIGYIRSDYLTLSGELKPLSETEVQPPEDTTPEPPAETEKPAEPAGNKRFETKLINDKWYILDYDASIQYEIDKLFAAAEEYKTLYEEASAKTKSQRVWLFIFGIMAFGFLGCSAYLVYRLKECKEEAFIAAIENNTLSSRNRTAERPRTDGKRPSGEKPVIKEGMGSQRPSGGQGQRPAGAQGQRPAGGQGQRPAGAPGQRPSGGQRPAGGQGQRPAGGQGQRPAGAPGQRPSGGQRPAGGQGAGNPQDPARAAENRAKSVNFMNNGGEDDIKVLDWDSDDE